MRKFLPFLLFFALTGAGGRLVCYGQDGVPAREAFINAIFPSVVDKSFSKYYLSSQAYPCSFVKYDYNEWAKYALLETVSIDILDDLARSSFYDRKPLSWKQDSLVHAVCIPESTCDSLLDPTGELAALHRSGSAALSPGGAVSTKAADKKRFHKELKAWSRLPAEDRTVFYFSRPLFTDDGIYAIIDLSYRCDARLCGMGATCLFKHSVTGWRLIGRKVNWGG